MKAVFSLNLSISTKAKVHWFASRKLVHGFIADLKDTSFCRLPRAERGHATLSPSLDLNMETLRGTRELRTLLGRAENSVVLYFFSRFALRILSILILVFSEKLDYVIVTRLAA